MTRHRPVRGKSNANKRRDSPKARCRQADGASTKVRRQIRRSRVVVLGASRRQRAHSPAKSRLRACRFPAIAIGHTARTCERRGRNNERRRRSQGHGTGQCCGGCRNPSRLTSPHASNANERRRNRSKPRGPPRRRGQKCRRPRAWPPGKGGSVAGIFDPWPEPSPTETKCQVTLFFSW